MSVESPEENEDPAGHSAEEPPTRESVLSVLDGVTDPELDRSIVELDYVDEVRVESAEGGARVAVEFTLPTAWCSPAFAWMMATDARDSVEAMRGVGDCTVRLRKHMHEEEVNEGVNERRSFADSFPDAEGGIADVRATLDSKARVARQYDAVETLLDAGVRHEQVAELTRDDFEPLPKEGRMAVYIRDRSVGLDVPSHPFVRYFRKADEVGLYDDVAEQSSAGRQTQSGDVDERSSSANRNAERSGDVAERSSASSRTESGDGDERVFRTPEGDPILPARAELVHRRARLANVNMSGQGGVCDALHEARTEELAGDD